MPPKTIGPRRAIAIEIILFLAYAFFSASWMVGSVAISSMNRCSPAKPFENISAKFASLRMGLMNVEI